MTSGRTLVGCFFKCACGLRVYALNITSTVQKNGASHATGMSQHPEYDRNPRFATVPRIMVKLFHRLNLADTIARPVHWKFASKEQKTYAACTPNASNKNPEMADPPDPRRAPKH